MTCSPIFRGPALIRFIKVCLSSISVSFLLSKENKGFKGNKWIKTVKILLVKQINTWCDPHTRGILSSFHFNVTFLSKNGQTEISQLKQKHFLIHRSWYKNNGGWLWPITPCDLNCIMFSREISSGPLVSLSHIGWSTRKRHIWFGCKNKAPPWNNSTHV